MPNWAKKTIVIGKNGTGKTALLNSIELALCGWASDYRGKAQIKRPVDIIRLAQDKEITVALTMSNGKTRTYHTKKRGKGATKAKTTGRSINTHFSAYRDSEDSFWICGGHQTMAYATLRF